MGYSLAGAAALAFTGRLGGDPRWPHIAGNRWAAVANPTPSWARWGCPRARSVNKGTHRLGQVQSLLYC